MTRPGTRGLKLAFKRVAPATMIAGGRHMRTRLRQCEQAWFDWRWGVNTRGRIPMHALTVRSPTVQFANRYEPTARSVFRRILASLDIDHPAFTFVDVGSGKGAVLLYASELPFRRIIGIEHAPELHAMAERNIASYRAQRRTRCRRIESVCADAVTYPLPVDPLVLYLFNPFRRELLVTLMRRVHESVQAVPRPVYVLSYNPIVEPVLETLPWLTPLGRGANHTVYRTAVAGNGSGHERALPPPRVARIPATRGRALRPDATELAETVGRFLSAYRSDGVARRLGLALLALIAAMVAAHVALDVAAHVGYGQMLSRDLSMSTDRGYPELLRYGGFATIVALLVVALARTRQALYGALAALYLLALVDDAALLHERFARYASDRGLWAPHFLDAYHFWQLPYWATVAGLFLGVYAWSHARSATADRPIGLLFAGLAAMLGFFAAGMDVMHAIFRKAFFGAKTVFAILEDGGEMLTVGVTLLTAILLVRHLDRLRSPRRGA